MSAAQMRAALKLMSEQNRLLYEQSMATHQHLLRTHNISPYADLAFEDRKEVSKQIRKVGVVPLLRRFGYTLFRNGKYRHTFHPDRYSEVHVRDGMVPVDEWPADLLTHVFLYHVHLPRLEARVKRRLHAFERKRARDEREAPSSPKRARESSPREDSEDEWAASGF